MRLSLHEFRLPRPSHRLDLSRQSKKANSCRPRTRLRSRMSTLSTIFSCSSATITRRTQPLRRINKRQLTSRPAGCTLRCTMHLRRRQRTACRSLLRRRRLSIITRLHLRAPVTCILRLISTASLRQASSSLLRHFQPALSQPLTPAAAIIRACIPR